MLPDRTSCLASTLTPLRKMTGWSPNNWVRCCVQMWPSWHKRKPLQRAKAW